jgi:hypothetical protein
MAAEAPLVCPVCAAGHAQSERFCERCGTPLVYAPGAAGRSEPAGERAERARKVRPQYSEGELVRVAAARNQAEGELLQGMLLEEGIPSLVQRSGGFDVPDFLASGPRVLRVRQSGAEAAREALGTASRPAAAAPPSRRAQAPAWVRALAAALAVLLLATVAAGVLTAVWP